MTKEAMKLALEALEDTLSDDPYPYSLESKAITALKEALAEPDFWEGYVPEPVKPAQQCKWPTCQSEEYQQALAEQIKRELVGEQPAQRTWVGLFWGELPEDGQNHDFLRGAVWAETKLKEKNT